MHNGSHSFSVTMPTKNDLEKRIMPVMFSFTILLRRKTCFGNLIASLPHWSFCTDPKIRFKVHNIYFRRFVPLLVAVWLWCVSVPENIKYCSTYLKLFSDVIIENLWCSVAKFVCIFVDHANLLWVCLREKYDRF